MLPLTIDCVSCVDVNSHTYHLFTGAPLPSHAVGQRIKAAYPTPHAAVSATVSSAIPPATTFKTRCPFNVCAVTRRRFPVGCKPHPARSSDLGGPLERWRSIRSVIHAEEVCARRFDPARNTFCPIFRRNGARRLDLLLIPLVGFPAGNHPRVRTVVAIERDLVRNGLVMRYNAGTGTGQAPAGRRRAPRLQG